MKCETCGLDHAATEEVSLKELFDTASKAAAVYVNGAIASGLSPLAAYAAFLMAVRTTEAVGQRGGMRELFDSVRKLIGDCAVISTETPRNEKTTEPPFTLSVQVINHDAAEKV